MPDHVAVWTGFDQDRARRIFAGSDALLMPSRFEPCGLAQMQAMRYGTLPIVNPVGGLGDTVEDAGGDAADHRGNGFRMSSPDVAGLGRAVARAAALQREPLAWSRAVHAAMSRDWSWSAPAASYLELYRRLA
jgi:starch synthase